MGLFPSRGTPAWKVTSALEGLDKCVPSFDKTNFDLCLRYLFNRMRDTFVIEFCASAALQDFEMLVLPSDEKLKPLQVSFSEEEVIVQQKDSLDADLKNYPRCPDLHVVLFCKSRFVGRTRLHFEKCPLVTSRDELREGQASADEMALPEASPVRRQIIGKNAPDFNAKKVWSLNGRFRDLIAKIIAQRNIRGFIWYLVAHKLLADKTALPWYWAFAETSFASVQAELKAYVVEFLDVPLDNFMAPLFEIVSLHFPAALDVAIETFKASRYSAVAVMLSIKKQAILKETYRRLLCLLEKTGRALKIKYQVAEDIEASLRAVSQEAEAAEEEQTQAVKLKLDELAKAFPVQGTIFAAIGDRLQNARASIQGFAQNAAKTAQGLARDFLRASLPPAPQPASNPGEETFASAQESPVEQPAATAQGATVAQQVRASIQGVTRGLARRFQLAGKSPKKPLQAKKVSSRKSKKKSQKESQPQAFFSAPDDVAPAAPEATPAEGK